MSEARESFLADEVLAEVAGRMKFGTSNLEDRLAGLEKPEPRQWSFPSHRCDDEASIFGLHGFEYAALKEAAMKEMPNNLMLQALYRKFLIAAKLLCDDQLEKVRAYEQKQARDKALRDSGYQERLRAYNSKVNKLTGSWSAVRETIRTRWNRMGRSILKLVEYDNRLSTIGPRDQAFIFELAKLQVVRIDRSEDRVESFNWEKYTDVPIEEMHRIVLILNDLPSGGFIKKPQVFNVQDGL
jgi:hypothetical protein